MADKKASELQAATVAAATDLLVLATPGTANKKITVGALSNGLPNVGNRGTTKNVVVNVADEAIALTGTVYKLTLANHTLSAGVTGQEVTLIGSSTTVTLTGAGTLTNIQFLADGSTCTLICVDGVWYVKSYFSVIFG